MKPKLIRSEEQLPLCGSSACPSWDLHPLPPALHPPTPTPSHPIASGCRSTHLVLLRPPGPGQRCSVSALALGEGTPLLPLLQVRVVMMAPSPNKAVDAPCQAVVPCGQRAAQPRAAFLKGPELPMDTPAQCRQGGAAGGPWREVLPGSGVGGWGRFQEVLMWSERRHVAWGPMDQRLLRRASRVGSVRPPPHHSVQFLPEGSAQTINTKSVCSGHFHLSWSPAL